jgi:hypothetical protein
VSKAVLVRLAGVTAHFRDPRYNTGKIAKAGSLPIRTLHCPPPCTIHGLLCAAKGGWVDTTNLVTGWRMDFDSVCSDFQTCRLPQRKAYSFRLGTQKVDISPRVREFLAFPILTIFAIEGVEPRWFRQPANPLSLGRAEDLAVEIEIVRDVAWSECAEGSISGQCLPVPLGYGVLYPAPLYFDGKRRPVSMTPKTDARIEQDIRDNRLARVRDTGETFFLWDYSRAAG